MIVCVNDRIGRVEANTTEQSDDLGGQIAFRSLVVIIERGNFIQAKVHARELLGQIVRPIVASTAVQQSHVARLPRIEHGIERA